MKISKVGFALVLFLNLVTTAKAEQGNWSQVYSTLLDRIPGVASDDPIIGLNASHIRDELARGVEDKTRKAQLEALADLLEKGKVIWTGSKPNEMVMHFVTPTGVRSIPHTGATVKYKSDRTAITGERVTDHDHSMKVVDPEGKLPPFYPEATLIENHAQQRTGGHVNFFFYEKGRLDDKDYKEVKLGKGDEATRQAIREKIVAGIKGMNDKYQVNRDSIAFGNSFVRDPKNLVDLDRDYEAFLGGMKKSLDLVKDSKEDREIKEALVVAIAKFEERFKPKDKKQGPGNH